MLKEKFSRFWDYLCENLDADMSETAIQMASEISEEIDKQTQKTENQEKLAQILATETFPKYVPKRWGGEEWLHLCEKYCYKKIHINAGELTSLQYHNHKEETNFIISGDAYYYSYVDGKLEKKMVGPGFYVTLKPGEIHRFEAITDIVLMEASSPEIWDVVRIEDAYGREGTSAA
jgi:mannose-6-phosphate isomerase